MKILDSIMSILMMIGGALLCGIRNTEFDCMPIGVVVIALGFIVIVWIIIENLIDRVMSNHNRKNDIIINFPKRERPAEKEEETDLGMEMDVGQLPKGIDFAVYQADKTYNDMLKEQIKKETLQYWIRYLYGLWTTFGRSNPEFMLENLKFIAKEYGFELEQENNDEQ